MIPEGVLTTDGLRLLPVRVAGGSLGRVLVIPISVGCARSWATRDSRRAFGIHQLQFARSPRSLRNRNATARLTSSWLRSERRLRRHLHDGSLSTTRCGAMASECSSATNNYPVFVPLLDQSFALRVLKELSCVDRRSAPGTPNEKDTYDRK